MAYFKIALIFGLCLISFGSLSICHGQTDEDQGWLSEAEIDFWEAFPVVYQVRNTRYIRNMTMDKLKTAASNAQPNVKREILNILAAQEIGKNTNRSEKVAKLFRKELAGIRHQIIESVLCNGDPWSAAADITRAVGGSGSIRRAWKSKKESYEAKLTALRLAQESLLKIVAENRKLAPDVQQGITAKLVDGDECVQLSLKSPIDLEQVIVILTATKKQTKGWAALNGGGAFFGAALGLTEPAAAQEAIDLAAVEQDFWNQKMVIGLMLDKLPAKKTCVVNYPVLNFQIDGVDSMEVEIVSNLGSSTKSLDVKKVQNQLKRRSAKGDRYAIDIFDRKYSLAMGEKSLTKSIYPGAIWRGTFKSVNGKRTTVNESAFLVINSIDEDSKTFDGVIRIGISNSNVTGKVGDNELSLRGVSYLGRSEFDGRMRGRSYKGERAFESSPGAFADRSLPRNQPGIHYLSLKFAAPRKSSQRILETVYLSLGPPVNDEKKTDEKVAKEPRFRKWSVRSLNEIPGVEYTNSGVPRLGKIYAKFVGYEEPNVLLEKQDGKVVRIHINSLGEGTASSFLEREYGVELGPKSTSPDFGPTKPRQHGGVF